MELTARAQLAYDLTGQAFLLGVAALSLGLPSTLMSIMGGALADRIPKRSMLLAAQVVLASSGLLLCLLLATGLIEFWHLVALGVVRGLTTGFSLPARPLYGLGSSEGRAVSEGVWHLLRCPETPCASAGLPSRE